MNNSVVKFFHVYIYAQQLLKKIEGKHTANDLAGTKQAYFFQDFTFLCFV